MTPYNLTVAEQINPFEFFYTGWTPATRGTLLIQNTCRDCYFEVYDHAKLSESEQSTMPPIHAPPPEPPAVTVAPESWAQVPLAGSRLYVYFMHGGVAPEHLEEVTLWCLPGACQIGAGPMGRHPLTP
jgi:hypothetical protein